MNSMPFENYEGFKELFVRKDGQRKNKILLAYIKTRELRKYVRNYLSNDDSLKKTLNPTDMATLFERVDTIIGYQSLIGHSHTVRIIDREYGSDDYKTDGQNGICIDGDISSYRYVNIDQDRVYKMKIGKMYKHLILNSEFGRLLPEQVVLWMCEEMTRKWEAWATAQLPDANKLTLHIDKDFYGIYDGDGRCAGRFGSCMSGGGHSDFYTDAVKAHAAYLTNEDGDIVARCVIFDEVNDNDTGEVFRYAERQYSSEGNELLQRVLIQKLIDGGHIDCYKRVGAGCGEKRNIVNVNGESMSNRHLWIECNLDDGDTLSYQDTFKNYDGEGVADNWGEGKYDLSCTDDNFYCDDKYYYSDYHNERILCDYAAWVPTRDDYFHDDEVVDARVWRNRTGEFRVECCFEDDVIEIGGQYYYAGYDASEPESYGLARCPKCGNYVLIDTAEYSELTGFYYCDAECIEAGEREYKESEDWIYSEYDDDYFETEEEVTVYFWEYQGSLGWNTRTISCKSLESAVKRGLIVESNGNYYDGSEWAKYREEMKKVEPELFELVDA